MEYIKSYLRNNIFLVIVIGILILTNVCSIYYFLYNSQNEECFCEECLEEEKEQIVIEDKIKVDIKGYVNNPGVYELSSGSIINDLIKLAGGLKTSGTTDNINLSKELHNEDMIVILSKSELKKLNTQTASTINSSGATANNAISNNSSSNSTNIIENKKISLNTATKEELMTLNGIGEAKALNIIEYRKITPFKDITEIMNITGIGAAVYENIKDYITI